MSDLPGWLEEAIEKELNPYKLGDLQKAAEQLMERYRNPQQRRGLTEKGTAFVVTPLQRAAYLGYRFPATFATITKVLFELLSLYPEAHTSISFLDLGAGPGTGYFAASELLPSLDKCTLLEQDRAFIELGMRLGQPKQVTWIAADLLQNALPFSDLTLLSYVLNEFTDADQQMLLAKAWEATQGALLLLEPGTPYGFKGILNAREFLLKNGAHIVAPCPHHNACPLAQIGDWCHFATRVERTRTHRFLKMGELGYEDEKYSYLIAAKHPGLSYRARLVKTPEKHSGHLKLTLCTENGLETPTLSKKQGELYKQARKLEWGDRMI